MIRMMRFQNLLMTACAVATLLALPAQAQTPQTAPAQLPQQASGYSGINFGETSGTLSNGGLPAATVASASMHLTRSRLRAQLHPRAREPALKAPSPTVSSQKLIHSPATWIGNRCVIQHLDQRRSHSRNAGEHEPGHVRLGQRRQHHDRIRHRIRKRSRQFASIRRQ